jgi:hypothetical protein
MLVVYAGQRVGVSRTRSMPDGQVAVLSCCTDFRADLEAMCPADRVRFYVAVVMAMVPMALRRLYTSLAIRGTNARWLGDTGHCTVYFRVS